MKNLYEPGVDIRRNVGLYFTHWLYNLMVKYTEPLELR
jgi:phage major head subunit gpT-like protein